MNLMTAFTPNCLQEVLRDSQLTLIDIVPVALNSLEDSLRGMALEALCPVALA